MAWRKDGSALACGSDRAGVELWDLDENSFSPIAFSRSMSIESMAWTHDTDWLAWGGTTGMVTFHQFANGVPQKTQTGVGHIHAITSMAWAHDGQVLVVGTSGGTIGLWPRTFVDPQMLDGYFELREALVTHDGRAPHQHPVHGLAWCPRTNTLASGSKDKLLCLWGGKDWRLLQSLPVDGAILDIAFSFDGKVLVVQTLHSLNFVQRDPLRLLGSFLSPASIHPVRTTIALHAESNRLATIDIRDHSIALWDIDFDGMVAAAKITRRSYHAAGVALIGEPRSGRSNLARALTGQAFEPEPAQRGFEVHTLQIPPVTSGGIVVENREVALWDLPSAVRAGPDYGLVRCIHTGNELAKIVVLDVAPGSLAGENLDAWKNVLKRLLHCNCASGTAAIVVATKCDRLRRQPARSETADLVAKLGVDKLIFVSAREHSGIEEVRDALLAAVDWKRAESFDSIEVFSSILAFSIREREAGRHLAAVRDLWKEFCNAHQFLGSSLPSETAFKNAVRVLRTLGEVETLDDDHDVVLTPAHFHRYALAIIEAAAKDTSGLARLARAEIEPQGGPHFQIPEALRLKPTQLERRLLHATVDELARRGVAGTVSTDEGSYLFLHQTDGIVWDHPPPPDQRSMSWKFHGDVEDVFGSLKVRLAGLSSFFSDCQNWRNAAVFGARGGGACGLVLDGTPASDEGDLSAFFRDGVSPSMQSSFVAIVDDQLKKRARDVRSERLAPPLVPSGPPAAPTVAEPIEVFFCHRLESEASQDNLLVIANQLRERNIKPWVEELEVPAGDAGERRAQQLKTCRIAAVIIDGPLRSSLRKDCEALVRRGCGIIPVLLPSAGVGGSKVPELLKKYVPVNFGELGGNAIDQLAMGIRAAWNTPAPSPGVASRAGERHVFLSYSREDARHVFGLRDAIKRRGHEVWLDEKISPGQVWKNVIREAIEDSYAFVVCLSSALQKRDRSGIYPEMDLALEIYKTLPRGRVFLIPVRLDRCEIPKVPISQTQLLSDVQHHDCFDADPSGPCLDPLIAALDAARTRSPG
jgi:WD40 repeat protein